MRILYVITLADLAGAQTHLLELMRYLSRDNEVILCCGTVGFLTDEAEKIGVQIKHLPSLIREVSFKQDIRAVNELSTFIEDIMPDVVHAHSTKAGLVARIAAWRQKVPCVFSAHGWIFDPNVKFARRMLGWLFELALVPITKLVIVTSQADLTIGRSRLPLSEKKMALVYNGFPEKAGKANAGETAERVIIIMAARFDYQKDHQTLIKALARIRELNFSVKLLGDGHLRRQCEKQVDEFDLSNRVEFLGTRTDFDDLLTQSHIYVLTTHHEGLPVSIIQAMRAKLPVVATRVNGVPEQVIDGETGYTIGLQDDLACANALRSLIMDAELRGNMGELGYTRYKEKFAVKNMSVKILSLYEKLAKEQNLGN